jgi:hypothetical protein
VSQKDETIFDHEEMKAYVVVAKLTSSELDALNRSIVRNGGQVVSSYEEATLVIANTRLWSRLSKYLTNYEKVGGSAAAGAVFPCGWLMYIVVFSGYALPLRNRRK